MKICRATCTPCSTPLKNICNGHTCQMVSRFHQDNEDDDLYLVVNRGSYMCHDEVQGKRVIVNLRSGKLSVVDQNREVIRKDAQVHVE